MYYDEGLEDNTTGDGRKSGPFRDLDGECRLGVAAVLNNARLDGLQYRIKNTRKRKIMGDRMLGGRYNLT